MKRIRRPSKQTIALLNLLLSRLDAGAYGYDIMQHTGLKSGTLYPILMRLKSAGHLEARWQTPETTGRPPRQIYTLTPSGMDYALAAKQQPVGRAAKTQAASI
jgi:DNA-binding PadR family transcriptional regulator